MVGIIVEACVEVERVLEILDDAENIEDVGVGAAVGRALVVSAFIKTAEFDLEAVEVKDEGVMSAIVDIVVVVNEEIAAV